MLQATRCMLFDAYELSPGTSLAADVCIVGAGAAGITLALALGEVGLEVLVLESGGLDFEDASQALYQGSMSGIRTWQLDSHRFRQFGGSTARWAGWCRPFGVYDFPERAYVPNSGWPITLQELRSAYERAHQRVELGDYIWDADELQALSGRPRIESVGGRMVSEVFQYSPPTRFGERYRPQLEQAENVKVYLHANVSNLELQPSHQELRQVSCRTLMGAEFSAEARAYVLAMGGLENARLLLASNSQVPDGVANSSGHVGRYFMEHPHYNGVSKLIMSRDADLGFYERHTVEFPNRGGTRQLRLMGVLALRPEVLANEGLLDLTASITEVALEPGETGPVDAEVARSVISDRKSDRAYQLFVRAEQSPRSDSRITLRTNDLDQLGMPRLDLDWKIHPDDERALRRSMEIIGAELAAAGLGRLWTSTDMDRLNWTALPGGHHMGTLRMTADPTQGVVDANCRCHDVENLYVAGSAVFTTGGAPNPTLTVVALAERLASHLQGVLE